MRVVQRHFDINRNTATDHDKPEEKISIFCKFPAMGLESGQIKLFSGHIYSVPTHPYWTPVFQANLLLCREPKTQSPALYAGLVHTCVDVWTELHASFFSLSLSPSPSDHHKPSPRRECIYGMNVMYIGSSNDARPRRSLQVHTAKSAAPDVSCCSRCLI